MGVEPILSVVLILLKHWRVTHKLDWLFSPCYQWFWSASAQTFESDSQSGWVFSQSCQWFHSVNSDSLAGWMFSQSHEWFSIIEEWLTSYISKVISLVKFTNSFYNITFSLFIKKLSGFNIYIWRNATYILPAFHKNNFTSHSTRYGTHDLNHLSISISEREIIINFTLPFFRSTSAYTF